MAKEEGARSCRVAANPPPVGPKTASFWAPLAWEKFFSRIFP